mmetsp:Transcript_76951/g.160119  ORF Transcript_76951/g.160119 Transcript_76951/m.160119 type:complete len:226 (+) Transcript_76951:311-988(+)
MDLRPRHLALSHGRHVGVRSTDGLAMGSRQAAQSRQFNRPAEAHCLLGHDWPLAIDFCWPDGWKVQGPSVGARRHVRRLLRSFPGFCLRRDACVPPLHEHSALLLRRSTGLAESRLHCMLTGKGTIEIRIVLHFDEARAHDACELTVGVSAGLFSHLRLGRAMSLCSAVGLLATPRPDRGHGPALRIATNGGNFPSRLSNAFVGFCLRGIRRRPPHRSRSTRFVL